MDDINRMLFTSYNIRYVNFLVIAAMLRYYALRYLVFNVFMSFSFYVSSIHRNNIVILSYHCNQINANTTYTHNGIHKIIHNLTHVKQLIILR